MNKEQINEIINSIYSHEKGEHQKGFEDFREEMIKRIDQRYFHHLAN